MALVMKWISSLDVHRRASEALGLDPDVVDLAVPETKAALLRRCAAYLCPCPPRVVLERALEVLGGVLPSNDELKDELGELLEGMIAYGDVFELSESIMPGQTRQGNILFLRPPSFVIRPSGLTFLIGIAPFDQLPILQAMKGHIEAANHIRRIQPRGDVDLQALLKQAGLLEVPDAHWLKLPPRQSFAQHLNRLNSELDVAPPSGDIAELSVLEPSMSVQYYKGRWQTLGKQTGRFVARRPQAYGADLWTYSEIRDGRVGKVIDLPRRPEHRGCDEAWRLQAAIDADRGQPQLYRVTDTHGGTHRNLEFFSPLPQWARRRFDVIGEPLSQKGCLFAYRLPTREFDQEVSFLQKELWMSESN